MYIAGTSVVQGRQKRTVILNFDGSTYGQRFDVVDGDGVIEKA